jgi:hypothetical protein
MLARPGEKTWVRSYLCKVRLAATIGLCVIEVDIFTLYVDLLTTCEFASDVVLWSRGVGW